MSVVTREVASVEGNFNDGEGGVTLSSLVGVEEPVTAEEEVVSFCFNCSAIRSSASRCL